MLERAPLYFNYEIMKAILDIGYSRLTERVFLGKSKPIDGKGLMKFIGEKIDITSKFLYVCEQFFPVGTSRVIKGEKDSLFIHIENTKEAKEKLIQSLQKEIK